MLLLFRPEENTFGIDSTNEYGYKWNDLQLYSSHLVADKSAISKFRFYAMHNLTHCSKQNRNAQKLMTLFRHRERDIWSENQHEVYMNIQASNDSRHKEDSTYQKTCYELSQEHLTTRTIHTYNMQLMHCNQLKNALNQFTESDSSSDCADQSHFTNHSCIDATMNLLEDSVKKVKKHIEKFNKYLQQTNAAGDPVYTSTDNEAQYNQPSTNAPVSSKLNDKQQETFNIFKSFLDSSAKNDKEAPYVVLLGGPGTGKSFVVKCLQDYQSTKSKTAQEAIVTCSSFGFPAVLIGGQTIHSLFGMKKGMLKETEVEISRLPDVQLVAQRSILKNMRLLIIDEISTTTPSMLYAIDARLRQIFSTNIQFGGIAILCLGDLMQLGPVGGSHIAESCVQYAKGILKLQGEKYRPESIWTKGTILFTRAKVLKLTKQQRAIDDKFHTEIIQNLHSGKQFQINDLRKYKILSKEDMSGHGKFRFAPILVFTNRERIGLSYFQLKQYALAHKIPIVKWKSKHQNWKNSPTNIPEAITNECAFFDYFCVNLPGFLTLNISTSLKLANGTPVQLKSVQFRNKEMQTNFVTKYTAAAPGEEILLELPPDYLTYKPYPEDDDFHKDWISNSWPTLDESKNCVILPLYHHPSHFDKFKSFPIQGTPFEGPSSAEICSYFSFQMAFAITIHKAQGRTMPSVILSLMNVQNLIKFSHIFVAFSRVKHHDNIRLLMPTGTNHEYISHITNLKPNRKILTYLKCIDEKGTFDASWISRYKKTKQTQKDVRKSNPH